MFVYVSIYSVHCLQCNGGYLYIFSPLALPKGDHPLILLLTRLLTSLTAYRFTVHKQQQQKKYFCIQFKHFVFAFLTWERSQHEVQVDYLDCGCPEHNLPTTKQELRGCSMSNYIKIDSFLCILNAYLHNKVKVIFLWKWWQCALSSVYRHRSVLDIKITVYRLHGCKWAYYT